MNFDKIEASAFESLKDSVCSNPQPKGDELPKIIAKAIRKAFEAYEKEKAE